MKRASSQNDAYEAGNQKRGEDLDKDKAGEEDDRVLRGEEEDRVNSNCNQGRHCRQMLWRLQKSEESEEILVGADWMVKGRERED